MKVTSLFSPKGNNGQRRGGYQRMERPQQQDLERGPNPAATAPPAPLEEAQD